MKAAILENFFGASMICVNMSLNVKKQVECGDLVEIVGVVEDEVQTLGVDLESSQQGV